MTMSRARSTRHALVRPGFGVRGRELLHQLGLQGRHDRGLIKIKSESRGSGPHLGLLAEQDQVRDPAAQQDRGSFENPIILALRQDDPLPIRARSLHELVLKHQRRTYVGSRDIDRGEQRCLINLLGEHPMRGLDLATRVLGDRAADPHQPLGGRKGTKISERDRQVLLDTFGEPPDAVGELISAGQQDSGQRRERARLVGQHQTGNQVSAVTGCDHRGIGHQSIQDVRQAHRCDDHAQ